MRIETPRLVLRRWRTADVDALAEIHAHPAIVEWLGPLTRADAQATVARYEHHWEALGFGRFAVEERGTGRLVGRVGVMRQPDWAETTEKDEVGWVIAADRWGEGLASKAAAAALADAFGRSGLARVVSFTLPENVASRRVMERCGLRYRGVARWKGRQHVWYDVWRETVSETDPRQVGDRGHGRAGQPPGRSAPDTLEHAHWDLGNDRHTTGTLSP